MSIHVNCPACGKTLKAPESAAGKMAKCPACGKAVDIPSHPPAPQKQVSLDPPAPRPAAPQPAAKPRSAPAALSTPSSAGTISVACPACSKTLKAPPSAAGKKAKCPACGTVMCVPGPAPRHEEIASGDELQEIPMPIMLPQMPGAGFPPMPGPLYPQPTPNLYAAEDFAPMGQQPFYSAAAAPVSAPAPAEGPRRPCRECGEMILETAAKCRFCGAMLDARLRSTGRRRRSGQTDGLGIASVILGVVALVCTLLGCVVCLAYPVGVVCAIVGLALAYRTEGGLRMAAVILNAVPLVLTLVLVLLGLLGLGFLALSGGPDNF